MAIKEFQTRNGEKRYKVGIWNKGQRYSSATFLRKSDAEIWENDQKSKIENEKFFPERPKKMLYQNLYEEWMRVHALKKKAPNSIKKDRQVYRDYIAPHFANIKIQDISSKNFDNFIEILETKTILSNNSINKVLGLMKTNFSFALKRGYIRYNPMNPVEMLPINEQACDYWSQHEASKFLSYAYSKYHNATRWCYVLYLLLLKTGIRLGEAQALTFHSVLFDQNIIRIDSTFDRALNEVKQTTKGKKIRYVPMDCDLKLELQRLNQWSKSNYVFGNITNKVFGSDNFRKRKFNRDIIESDVKKIRMHDLRHTFASHYMMNGGNLHDLQLILGHSETKMTMRYAHLSPGHIASKASIVRFDINKNVLGKVLSM